MALSLGTHDRGALPPSARAYFLLHHEPSMKLDFFRREENERWEPMREQPSAEVRKLQTRLRDAGFMPHSPVDGIFGYLTLSAVRLFQEYVRTVEGRPDIGAPDGIAGPNTMKHLDRWAATGLKAAWAGSGTAVEHARWLRFLRAYKQQALARPSQIQQQVNAYAGKSDTLKPAAWNYDDPAHIHLVGIRRNAGQRPGPGGRRHCDDVFVLLANGLVFKFYGSTDPNLHPSITSRKDEPYIVPGQHRFRFGWHLIGRSSHTYRAFRPQQHGVLVVRDRNGSDTLDAADRLGGPALDVNIHWSGVGTTNWSAGCQVVAGARYENPKGHVIDCRAFAASGYAALGGKTRGAYNVLVDLIATLAERCQVKEGTPLLYTLVNEEDLALEPELGQGWAAATLARLNR